MSEFLMIPIGGKSIRVRKSDIVKVESCNGIPLIYLSCGAQHSYSHGLKVLEEVLNRPFFYRVHRSHTINLNKIIEVYWNDGYVLMENDLKVPIAARNRSEFRRILDMRYDV